MLGTVAPINLVNVWLDIKFKSDKGYELREHRDIRVELGTHVMHYIVNQTQSRTYISLL